MSYNTLTVAEQGGIATITFNRPEKRNAISYELIDELLRVLGALERSSAQIVVLTGAGKAFCAGMDLDNLRALTGRTPEQNRQDSETMGLLFRSIYEFPKPTIAAVNGPAIAGGCGIATLCDFTVASADAKFGYTEVRIGFLPAIVSTFLLRQVGEKHARDLLLTGRIIGASEAYHIGLVNEVVEPERLTQRAGELAAQLMENSPASLAATKQLLTGFSFEELNATVRAAVDANARIRATHDFREGISSFLEKRKPVWKGQ
ncbi:MAG TPA: enoyl-CoA hydratase-related protein [Clostridia bacterium]|nr:enoyl-CoA hydratase-related protein [Clostridia bacterium]